MLNNLKTAIFALLAWYNPIKKVYLCIKEEI